MNKENVADDQLTMSPCITPSSNSVLKAQDNVITSSQQVEESSSASNAFGDDVEAEANTYFHKMFSGVLSVDAMVQILSRYKNSLVQREKLIFECMIANLFEEYRFFPKYPERQLKIAPVLFGSVIKHKLISSLNLETALRQVLDSLRKPADSKMFLFGSKALEQALARISS